MGGYFDGTLGSDPVHQDCPHHGLDPSILDGAVIVPKPIVRMIPCATKRVGWAVRRSIGCWLLKRETVMERVFIGATRAEATRMADEWWGRQKGLRQTLRTEVAVGRKGPDTAQLDQWAITIRFEDENSGPE